MHFLCIHYKKTNQLSQDTNKADINILLDDKHFTITETKYSDKEWQKDELTQLKVTNETKNEHLKSK